MSEIETRLAYSTKRTDELKVRLADAESLVGQNACVYATGSLGRRELSEHSDLDLFIVSHTEIGSQNFSNIDLILLKAKLVKVNRELGFPDFDGDGRFLENHKSVDLVDNIGKIDDDYHNFFTARLLLLLESYPLIGIKVYNEVIDKVIESYWRDFDGHEKSFAPVFLVNDIIRLWRTFCVNYEARTKSVPEEQRIKRKVKNYKLKYSRMVTCYSTIVYLLHVYARDKTVTIPEIKDMTRLTPIDRLRKVQECSTNTQASQKINVLLQLYDSYLYRTKGGESSLIESFKSPEASAGYMKAAGEFGEAMKEAIDAVGQNTVLHRVVLV